MSRTGDTGLSPSHRVVIGPLQARLPDRITIFQKPLEAMCRTRDDLKEAVKDTVKHEFGHYFGLDDARLEELMEE